MEAFSWILIAGIAGLILAVLKVFVNERFQLIASIAYAKSIGNSFREPRLLNLGYTCEDWEHKEIIRTVEFSQMPYRAPE